MSAKPLFVALFGVATLSAASANAQAQTCQWLSPYDGYMYHGIDMRDHGAGPARKPIVVLDFWGNYDSGYPSYDTSHDTFVTDMQYLLGDPAFWSRYRQYGGTSTGSLYGPGVFFNSAFLTGLVTDAQIQKLIDQNDIPGGMPAGLGQGTNDYIDVVLLPPGLNSSTITSGKADPQGYGFHHTFVSTYLPGVKIAYAVINTYSPTSSNESSNTITASHEIMEATTDPDLGNGYVSDHPTSAETFGDGGATPEIGDLCNGMVTYFGPASHRVPAQQSWLQNECRCDASATHNDRSFQALDTQDVFVLGTDGKLWWERAPFGSAPPARSQIDATVRTFQAINASNVFVLGNDGNLWYEVPSVFFGWGPVPPPREQVDGAVESFQALDLQNILVLGTDDNLWLEHAPFGTVPPPGRQQIDGNVRSYQGIDTQNVFVLGSDGNLWIEHAPFGSVPPTRQRVSSSVDTFHAVDLEDVFVLKTDGTLWLEQGPWGSFFQRVTQVDGNAASVKPIDRNTAYVLGTDGKLWLEHGPFGSIPPVRQEVDASVLAYDALDAQNAFVLGRDGNLWLTPAPFGSVPNPRRELVDGTVQP
jgi:hypothetical protein